MRPGISIEYATLPSRRSNLVRCDVAGFVGLVPPGRWPANATRGDFLELRLKSAGELRVHPARGMFSAPLRQSVEGFFDNGGELCHLFGLCMASLDDLRPGAAIEGLLSPLLQRLGVAEDIAMIAAPDAAYAPVVHRAPAPPRSLAEPLFDALLAHCREMGNRFTLLDAPRGLHGSLLLDWVEAFRDGEPSTRSFGALYYPWLQRGDTVFPASGAMAGVYSRVEHEHEPFGVVWPPANVELRSVTNCSVELGWDEVGVLAEHSVNPLVVQPGRGVVVWGARTLSRQRNWRYVNSRRIASMIVEQLRRDNAWAVFEPNDSRLWKVLERDVGVRLQEFWRAGLLTGETRQGDYLVKCDAEVNPPSEREAGRMNVQLRIRPVGTTEHITIDLRLGDSLS